jgi:EAL domain-containing protein (putative c-di-GMP-specific phosphodiesterase class I)/GGDEF domain-containing protein
MYVIDFDIVAIVLSCITLFLFYERKRRRFGPSMRFILLSWAVLGSSFMSMISSLAIDALPGFPPGAVIAAVTLFYLFHASIPFFAARYILDVGNLYPSRKTTRALIGLPWAIALLAVFLNPVTRSLSYVDASGSYRHGPAFVALYAISLFYLLIIGDAIFLHRGSYSRTQRLSFIASITLPIAAIIGQVFYGGLMLECFGASLGTLFALITIQNGSDLLDGQTGLYHRESFIKFLEQAFKDGERFGVFIAYSEEIADFQGNAALRTNRELVGAVSKWLSGESGSNSTTSYLRTGMFALIFKRHSRADPIGNLSLKLLERSAAPWNVGSLAIRLSFRILILNCPDDAKTVADVMDYIDQLADSSVRSSQRHVFGKSDFIAGKHGRAASIVAELERRLDSGDLDLRFQPIYSIAERRIVALEVLVGLSFGDKERVRQSELLAIAERSGMSRLLAERVMDRSFEWYASNGLARRGIRQIQLRLVSSLGLDLDWPDTVMRSAAVRSMDLSNVCLEITETTVARLGSDLYANMKRLSDLNVVFALDDFGSGYTNFVQLAQMPFSLVKFDKKIIQPGLADLKGNQLIQGTMSLFRGRGYSIAAEGIESEIQAEELALMGCDYLQGYYFGKPMPGDEILGLLDDAPAGVNAMERTRQDS